MTHEIFGFTHVGEWRDGGLPRTEGTTYVVRYDQRNDAYYLARADFDAFVEWVARVWETDTIPREDDEEAPDYLERLGVTIDEMT